jgi:hypothetical protein
MKLLPTRPPGSNARKARAFAAEIRHLRAQGYTFEAIREALAGAGIHVSNSTVQREVARAIQGEAAHTWSIADRSRDLPTAQPQVAAPSEPQVTLPDVCASPGRSSGKDIAADFMGTRITNPLFRPKEKQ